jgi:hypothetical protein
MDRTAKKRDEAWETVRAAGERVRAPHESVEAKLAAIRSWTDAIRGWHQLAVREMPHGGGTAVAECDDEEE